MNPDDLKSHVAAALREEWPAFAARHPHLSAAIEETAWVVVVADSIRDDPQFQSALASAKTLGTLLDQGQHLVRNFVGEFLKRLG